MGDREGKSFHEGDYPIFASFTYKNRRDLFKQVSLFMQGIRSKENKQENNFEQQVLEKCKSNIEEAQDKLQTTSDPEEKQKITEQIAMFQQKAQRKYLDLQTFANSLPDDKTGNAKDKAKINGILLQFSEFKPSVKRTRTTLENYHNEIRVLRGQLKGADTEAKKQIEADIKTLEGKAQGAYQDLQTFANSLPDDNGTNTGDATDKADAQTLLDEFSEFKPSIDASPQPAVESSSKHPVKNFFKNLFKRA